MSDKFISAVPHGFERYGTQYGIHGPAAEADVHEEDGNKIAYARAALNYENSSDFMLTVADIGVQAGVVKRGDAGVQAAAEASLLNIRDRRPHGVDLAFLRVHGKLEAATRHVEVNAGMRGFEIGGENKEGDVFNFIGGLAAGLGIQWGNDPDGDGHQNYGIKLSAALGVGAEVGFSLEPSTWKWLSSK
jgi:hypothetical protein